jgi:uncharacterized protein YukE
VTAADEYSNTLEQMFARLPGWLQAPLSPFYHEIDGLLRQVAGNPPELLQAGGQYADIAAKIGQLAGQQAADRTRLVSGRWQGEAYNEFSAVMSKVEAQLQTFGKALGSTKEVLASAAQACTDGADAICQIVATLIAWLISSFVVNVVLALFTLGASLAAEAAEALAGAAESLAQAGQVVDRVATVLERVESVLQKIAEIMRTVQRGLLVMLRGVDRDAQAYNESISAVRLLYRTTNAVDALFPGGAGTVPELAFRGTRLAVGIGQVVASREIVDHATLDSLHVPQTLSEGEHSSSSFVQTVKDAGQAEREAGETPGH